MAGGGGTVRTLAVTLFSRSIRVLHLLNATDEEGSLKLDRTNHYKSF